MDNKAKPSIHKINAKIIKDLWSKRNIELLGKFKKGGINKVYYNSFRFIEEDYTINSTNCLSPLDYNLQVYNNSIYVADYLKDNGGISEEAFNTYRQQLDRLVNGQVIS